VRGAASWDVFEESHSGAPRWWCHRTEQGSSRRAEGGLIGDRSRNRRFCVYKKSCGRSPPIRSVRRGIRSD